jgi:hypothetical protein
MGPDSFCIDTSNSHMWQTKSTKLIMDASVVHQMWLANMKGLWFDSRTWQKSELFPTQWWIMHSYILTRDFSCWLKAYLYQIIVDENYEIQTGIEHTTSLFQFFSSTTIPQLLLSQKEFQHLKPEYQNFELFFVFFLGFKLIWYTVLPYFILLKINKCIFFTQRKWL